MNLCDDRHQEICYDSRNCPLCAKMDEIAVMEDEMKDLKKTVEDLQEEQ